MKAVAFWVTFLTQIREYRKTLVRRIDLMRKNYI